MNRITHCKHCGAKIIRISRGGGRSGVYDAEPVMYWSVHKKGGGRYPDNKIVEVTTPNGELYCATLTGDPKDAVGIGYLAHVCGQACPTKL